MGVGGMLLVRAGCPAGTLLRPAWRARLGVRVRAWASAEGGAPSPSPLGPGVQPQGGGTGKGRRAGKRRLDEVVLERHPEYSRSVVQSFIAQGKVYVEGAPEPTTKSGAQVRGDAAVELRAETPRFVCRAGLKLEHALDHFGLDVAGLRCLDAGLSTGGFTDCLLQRGAARVYGVDVGYGQVAEKVRADPRVTLVERTNLRHMEGMPLGEAKVDLVSLDLSFISVLLVMPAVSNHLLKEGPDARIVLLVKPHFEGTRAEVERGGVVNDPVVRQSIVDRVLAGVEGFGFACMGITESPLKGGKGGNTEYVALFRRAEATPAEVQV